MGRSARGITVSERQRGILKEMVDARSTPRGLAERAAIVLASANGTGNEEQAQILRCRRATVRLWRGRWGDAEGALGEAEARGATDRDLTEKILAALSDLPRPGAPARFTAEQLAKIISVACEKPEDCGVPVTHWTPPELAREVMKRGIVDSISPRHLDRFLKGGRSAAPQVPLLAHFAGQAGRPASLRPGRAGAVLDVPRSPRP
jgi:transposase